MIPAPKNGFTLIELIIVIIVLSLMGAIIAPLMGPALTDSHRPLENLDHATDLSAEMAKVVAEYRNTRPNDFPDMNDFQDSISGVIDTEIVEITANERVMVDDVETEPACDPIDSLDCVLKVRLQSKENPGETLTYYFPYQR